MGSSLDLSTLIVPEQQTADKGNFDTHPKAIKAWIESLPMANLGETSRMVFKVIVELNRTTLPASQRLKTLELLTEPVMFVSTSLEKYFSGRPLPLKPKYRKISELARALLSEMATGYKLVATDLLAAKTKPHHKEISLAVHRAMYYLGILLLRCYQVYAPYPKNLWKEIHSLYDYAEHHKIASNRFTLPDTVGVECSLTDIYKRILLMSLSMPYQLLRGEIDLLVNTLCKFAPKLHINRIPGNTRPEGLFIIDMDADREPVYLITYEGDDFNHCRLLDMSELVKGMNSKDITSRLPENLLHRLLTSWSMMPKRSFSRSSNSCPPVEVAFGLSAAHHFVCGELDFNPDLTHNIKTSLGEKSEFTSTFVANESDEHKGPDMWSSNYSYSDNDPINAPALTQPLSDETCPQSVSYSKLVLEMVNNSAGGYCLIAGTDDIFSAHVGDLLAIREQHNIDIDQWGVGVIRRMKNTSTAKIELGIQMLTPNAVAVAARVIGNNGTNKGSQFLRCLMLPELRAINQPATLITPNLPFKEGSQILLNINNRFYQANLKRTLQQTRSFSQFEFTMSEAAVEDEKTGTHSGPTINESDFESIWQTL